MSFKRVVLFAALALLLVPSAVLADGVTFGFTGGVTDIFTTGPVLTTAAGVGVPMTMTSISTFSGSPGFFGNLGTGNYTTGAFISNTATDAFFAAGGSIVFQLTTALGNIPSGTTLFSGTFVPINTAVFPGPNPMPVGMPAGTAAVWSIVPCSTPQPPTTTCMRLYGTISGTVDPQLLALLGLTQVQTGDGWIWTLDMTFTTCCGANIGIGHAQVLIVPEPTTLALFGTGLLGIAGLVRRRMKI